MQKYLTITEYANKYGTLRQNVYYRIGEGIIPKSDIILIPRKGTGMRVMILNKFHKRKEAK